MMKNLLLKGDNLEAMLYLIRERGLSGKVDLIYTDPPFATNVNFTITKGRATTISNSQKGDLAYSDKVLGKDFLDFLRKRVTFDEGTSIPGGIHLSTYGLQNRTLCESNDGRGFRH